MNLLSLREVSTLPIGMATSLRKGMLYLILALLMVMSTDVFAHAVAQGDKGYIKKSQAPISLRLSI